MTAVEALWKARATMECIACGGPLVDGCDFRSIAPDQHETYEPLMDAREYHAVQASALLDGFTCDELTAVGG